MKINKFSFLFIFLLVCQFGFTQNRMEKRGDFMFDNLAYVEAIEIYENIISNGKGDAEVTKKLGQANYQIGNYKEAAKWYEKLVSFSNTNQLESTTVFQYGQSLKAIGKYNEADEMLRAYYTSLGYDYIDYNQHVKDLKIDSNLYEVSSFELNSKFSEYPAFLMNEDLFIVSANTDEKTNLTWNNEPSSDIFRIEENVLKSMDKNINTKYNEGSMAISEDGKTIYFTRNNYSNDEEGKDANNIVRLKLYYVKNEKGAWSKARELPFNNNEYSVGHPTLSPNGTKLYFVSDKPVDGKNEGTDIYEVEILDNNRFGTPKNLESINTPGNEMFPFIAADGTLYFSSNGHPNRGGLDVFKAQLDSNNDYGFVKNLGASINSEMDDFAFMINDSLVEGYFASNRNTIVSDDIFKFKIIEKQKDEIELFVLRGIVKDKRTQKPIVNSIVELLDSNRNVVASVPSDEKGLYNFDEVDLGIVKYVSGSSPNYNTIENEVDENNPGGDISLVSVLENLEDENAEILSNIIIYFDFDKYDIRPDAKIQLQRVINMMTKYPDLEIDIASHTDSRGTDDYNMVLSNKRAAATINYITNYGIDKARLVGAGYGEQNLQNKCDDSELCSENDHQLNRRSEFALKFETVSATNQERISQDNFGLYYTVQIGVFANPEMPKLFEKLENVKAQHTDKGYIKYSQGHYGSINQALGMVEEMHDIGVKDAYVTAYYNGNRITIRESIALLDKYGEDVFAFAISK